MINDGYLLVTILITLKITLFSTFLSLIFGIVFANLIVNIKSKLSIFLEMAITFPLYVPPTVMGFYLLLLLGRNGYIGSFLYKYFSIDFIFSKKAAVLASFLASLPIVYRIMKTFFESFDKEIINAAKIDGANGYYIFVYIKIPLAIKGVLSSLMLSFLRGIGEFGITMMIAGNIPAKTQTISLRIYDKIMSGKIEEANIYTFLLVLLTAMILLFIKIIDKKMSSS